MYLLYLLLKISTKLFLLYSFPAQSTIFGIFTKTLHHKAAKVQSVHTNVFAEIFQRIVFAVYSFFSQYLRFLKYLGKTFNHKTARLI